MGTRGSVAPSEEGPEAAHGIHRLQARPHLTGGERFPRSRRLVRGTDLRRVQATGRRSRRPSLDVIWAPGTAAESRLGLVVPRFRQTAVSRNRLRRRLKEIWRRELAGALPGPVDLVVRVRPEAYRLSFAELRAELAGWLETFG